MNGADLPCFHCDQNFPVCRSRWFRYSGDFQFSSTGKRLLNDDTFDISGRCCSCGIPRRFGRCHRINYDQKNELILSIRSDSIEGNEVRTALVVITLVSCFTSSSYSRRLRALTRLALFDVILSPVSAREHFYLSNAAITLFLRFLSPLFFHSCLWKTPFPNVPLVDRAADLGPLLFSHISPENIETLPAAAEKIQGYRVEMEMSFFSFARSLKMIRRTSNSTGNRTR